MPKWDKKQFFNPKSTEKILEKIKVLCLGKKTARTFIVLCLLGLLTLAITPRLIAVEYPKENEFSQRTIKAPYSFSYKDKDATLLKQKEAAASVSLIYTLDLTIIPPILQEVAKLFDQTEEVRQDKKLGLEQAVKKFRQEFETLKLEDEDIEILLIHPQLFELETDITTILRTCLGYGLTQLPVDRLNADIQKGINLHIVSDDSTSERTVKSIDEFFFMPSLPVQSSLYPELRSTSKARKVVFDIANNYLQPNLTFNPKKTEKAIKEAVKQVKPVMLKVSKGEKIVGDGEKIDRIAAIKLEELSHHRATTNINLIIGSLILLYTLMFYTLIYLYRYHPQTLSLNKNLILIGLIMVTIVGITKAISSINWPLYTIPVAAASMLLAILLNQAIAIFVTFSLSILLGILTGGNLSLVLLFISGGLAAIYFIPSVRMRGDMIKPGLAVSVGQGLVILGYGLSNKEALWIDIFWGSIVNGVASTILAMGVLPYLERIFNISTNFKLFELSDLNASLLKGLLLKAPGTYHHSLLVANLAETSAEAVGANSLLARVAAYYHDIGKMSRAEYFAENQIDMNNKHASIKTSLSVSVLKSHVKEGVEMAKRHNLPQSVVDIIQQHHGDSLMSYFYHQAKEEEASDSVPNKLEFSYPGPKPQTKEAAIVMLADSVEAASKSLAKPTPVRVEGMVKKIINNKFIDGELDDCDLSLMDLNKIAQVFIRSLTTLFHSRVEYPEKKEEETKKDATEQGEIEDEIVS